MYIIGILIGLYLKLSVVFLCITTVIISIILYLITKKIWFIILICILLTGSIYIKILDANYDKKYLDIYDEAKIRAIVISEPEEKEYKYTYKVRVKAINNEDKYKNTELIFNLKKSDSLKYIPAFGDEIEIDSKIEIPDGARNYKGFNYKLYLKSKNIYGTIESNEVNIISHNNVDLINKFINNVQKNLKKNISSILDENEAALCIGIIIGDREAITDEIEDNFKRSNLTHMLAVSGSHITYIITGFAVILSKTNKKFSKIFTIIFLIFFMALTEFTASVIRASIMGIVVLISSIIHRKSDTINNLGISSLLMLILNPYTITDIGFILSFGGTIGIVLLNNKINQCCYNFLEKITKGKINFKEKSTNLKNKIINGVINSFSLTFSANIIIIPIMAYTFSTVSFTFWISNILAGPLMEIATIFGFIVYVVSIFFLPLARFLGIFLNIIISLLLKIAELSSLIPGSSIYIKTPYLLECIIYYLIIFCLYNIKVIRNNILVNRNFSLILKYRYKILSLLILIVISTNIFLNIMPKNLKIYFVDVGQGDCTLIKTPTNKNILIDGGGSEFGNFDVGENILLPYLLDRRILNIDYLMISHFDSDHIGGLFSIIENLNVKNIIISKQGKESENLKRFYEIINKKKINVYTVKKGDYIKIDKYSYFEILFPEAELIQENILNNNSIVARFNALDFSMLFTGDIEEIAESRLVEIYKNSKKLEADVLKVAHHGSKTSTTLSFLDLVKPKIVFIGVGKDNNFGHPNNGVLDRIKKYTNLIYRTDENGEIELLYNKNKLQIDTIM